MIARQDMTFGQLVAAIAVDAGEASACADEIDRRIAALEARQGREWEWNANDVKHDPRPVCRCGHLVRDHFASGCAFNDCSCIETGDTLAPLPAPAPSQEGAAKATRKLVPDYSKEEWMRRAEIEGDAQIGIGPPPSPTPPRDGWTTLGELKPGDVFETKDGAVNRIDAHFTSTVGDLVSDWRGTMWSRLMPVRRLLVVDPHDEAVVEAVRNALVDGHANEALNSQTRRILAALQSLAERAR